MYKEMIKPWFYEAVKNSNANYELKDKILKNRGLTPQFIAKLEDEIMKATHLSAIKLKQAPKMSNVKELTQDLTITWLNSIEQKNQEMIMSDLEKRAKRQEQEKIKEFNLADEGIVTGQLKEYEKDGLILDEKIMGKR